MQLQRNNMMIGRYAIYFRSLTDTMLAREKAFFGGHAKQSALHKFAFSKSRKQRPQSDQRRDDESTNAITRLNRVVEKSQNILVKATAVFPFDFFPDSITVDRQKLTVVHRDFFTIKRTVSVQYGDIKNIQADIGPFLASLIITSEHFINNTQTIRFLLKKEALAIQQLVQGFIIAEKEHIDCSTIDDQKLITLLSQLGRGEAGEKVLPMHQPN